MFRALGAREDIVQHFLMDSKLPTLGKVRPLWYTIYIQGVPKKWFLEWCWSLGAPPQSPVTDTPLNRTWRSLCLQFFWLFLTKTKQNQAHPSYVHEKIWFSSILKVIFLAHPVCIVKYLYWAAVHHKTPVVSRTCTLARFIIHKSNISAHIERATVCEYHFCNGVQHGSTFHRSVYYYYYHTQQTSNTYSKSAVQGEEENKEEERYVRIGGTSSRAQSIIVQRN